MRNVFFAAFNIIAFVTLDKKRNLSLFTVLVALVVACIQLNNVHWGF